MRKLFDLVLLLAALGAAWHQFGAHKKEIYAAARILKARIAPCSSPVRYSVGAIDPRFGVTREMLTAALKEAEAAWETAAHRDLFEHAQTGGDVPVNMVYDNRQYALDKLKALGMKTDQSLAAYEELKARYEALAALADLDQSKLKAALEAYRSRETAHNARVAHWNRLGEVPGAERRRIKAAGAALKREFASVKGAEAAVNANIDTLNALATTLNQLIVRLNLDAAQYNREGSTMGRYEEGLYRVSGGEQSIELYAYSGREQLVSLLAHELGHAAGLEHVADTEAVMHLVNRGGELKITAADLAGVETACTSALRRRPGS